MHATILRSLVVLSWVELAVACGGGDGGANDGHVGDTTAAETSASGTASESSTSVTASASSSGASESSAADASTTVADDTGTDTEQPPEVELGAVCPLPERIGELRIWLEDGAGALYGVVWDGPDPWVGPAEQSDDDCAFHRFAPRSCGECEAPYVCSFAGECVQPRMARTDAELDVTIDGDTQTITANGVTGELYGTVGDAGSEISMTLRFAGVEIEVPALGFAAVPDELAVTGDGDSCVPLGLDASWLPVPDDARVRTVIPINHHAGGPTFTVCDVPAANGNFHVDAEMLQPLAVITCLEFQGLDVAHTAALHTERGCVDVRIGVQVPPDLQWE